MAIVERRLREAFQMVVVDNRIPRRLRICSFRRHRCGKNNLNRVCVDPYPLLISRDYIVLVPLGRQSDGVRALVPQNLLDLIAIILNCLLRTWRLNGLGENSQ